ncbi:hypothetical protein LMG28614_05604 [Paraburkholderia ultramafica]|uniref:HEXXH motif domain-containing protein n=1 Tax=Paraburkholderia ultramafica TaxID=1544867 RepID=A0A6S7DDH5_9BURK|nr:hypothetical protein [Paraburkholderia ultramafica]CAB3802417.1 hypothetical protein LMG28614_05604 [Paraburkholderia ultramafica]
MHGELNPDCLGDALSWIGDTDLAERLDAAFTAESEAALRVRISPSVAERLDCLSGACRNRLVRAPEITRQTLFAPTLTPSQIDAFVDSAVQVESALIGVGLQPTAARWSALGDVMLADDGTFLWWPQITGANPISLDFGSPWAQRIDLSGRLEFCTVSRPALTDVEVHFIHGRLVGAMGELQQLSPVLPKFVSLCTRVLVLQIDPLNAYVASGSNGRFVGRSFIANPQRAEATTDCLAEAVVHEAIHGLMYCESLHRPWACGDAAVEVARVESPWTGRALPIRPFLEAACVWFGLVHLWALALRSERFERKAAHMRLMRSVRGFCRGSLVDRARPWWHEIRPDVLTAVDCLQARVVEALGDAT